MPSRSSTWVRALVLALALGALPGRPAGAQGVPDLERSVAALTSAVSFSAFDGDQFVATFGATCTAGEATASATVYFRVRRA